MLSIYRIDSALFNLQLQIEQYCTESSCKLDAMSRKTIHNYNNPVDPFPLLDGNDYDVISWNSFDVYKWSLNGMLLKLVKSRNIRSAESELNWIKITDGS